MKTYRVVLEVDYLVGYPHKDRTPSQWRVYH